MSMSGHAERDSQPSDSLPAAELRTQARAVLQHAVDAHRKDIKVYESLRNLNEVVGTEYGDRVLYELIQNAHDAHRSGDRGRVEVRLTVRSASEGTLYVANGGGGFRWKDVAAIMNLATTAKEIGESIGNKGLGFRSVEALTDDVRIFSRIGRNDSKRFDGYCFRFAEWDEIERLLHADGVDTATARVVAGTVPRYLVPRPLTEQPDEVVSYARRGYASVIVLPLRTAESIDLAKQQVQALADLDVPLLLFLDRIADFRIDVRSEDGSVQQRRLTRRQNRLASVPGIAGCRLQEVRVGEKRRFLVVQHKVDKARVLDAVEQSIPRAPQIKRWLSWKGQPTVSVAVALSPGALTSGRLFNFLPMGDTAAAPLLGHLDAPFFADIDRRDADFDLPLNMTLMTAAAEACAHAALYLAGQTVIKIPQGSVFDLIAWTGNHAGKLDAALESMGNSLAKASIVPVVAVDGVGWAKLAETKLWPEGAFSLMKVREVAKRTGARLVSPEIQGERLHRLQNMAVRKYLDLAPSDRQLAEWSERFARSLSDRQAAPRTWSRFYEDLNRLFEATDEELNALAGKTIMLDRSKKLRPAGGHDSALGASIFVRDESTRRRRAKGGVPLPPATLTRRYRFVDEKIAFRRDTLKAFIDAGLVRQYDPVEALAGLGAALGKRANDNRRREALTWAFRVWRSAGPGIQEAMRSARLQVPTSSGWKPATMAAFSSSWTPVGQTLENFLVEAADTSPDCRRARDALLVDFLAWPPASGGTKRQWVEFLKLLDVVDGLKPVAAAVQTKGVGRSWSSFVRNGDSNQGLDDDWCREASRSNFGHPYTGYQRRGNVWRLPGQIEHANLSEIGQELFHELAFRHLEASGAKYLTFDVGRFERDRYRDRKTLPTPLASFLKSKAWIAVNTDEETRYLRVSECWAGRTKRDRPPRFIERVSDTISELVQGSEEFADLVFGDALGLRDWHSRDTATERLQVLAVVAPNLGAHERADFRKEYRRAWHDVVSTETPMAPELELAVIRDGGLETLAGDPETVPTVIVTQNAQESAAKILSSAGHALLDVGDSSIERVTERLAATGAFTPRGIDGTGVRLLVDGEPFVPRSNDPQLSSFQLGWLTEVVLLGHEILAERLERGVQRATVERRVRALRVRRCRSISLVVDESEVSPRGAMNWYGFEHAELPTLILTEDVPLSWLTLSRDLARTVERLLDTRFRFLEPLLLRLFQSQDRDSLHPPSDDVLAAALRCDAAMLQEHRAALRTDLGHVLHLLTPVVAYFGDVELARRLEEDAERGRDQFDVSAWLGSWFPVSEPAPADLIAACEGASNRAALRRELGLDYEQFNRVLQALGEATLSNEAELRSMYDAYRRSMGPQILERLRRCHVTDFREGGDLAVYVARKSLAFLEFDPMWVLTRETFDNEIVEAHVARLLDEELGQDKQIDLPSFPRVLDKNRKVIRDFASRAIPVVGAWCRANGILVPDPWRSEDPQAVTRNLENSGLLDFDPVADQQVPAICHRTGCWPEGMGQTLEAGALGLDPAAVDAEAKRRKREREQKVIDERRFDFAGARLDPGDPSFAKKFQELAEQSIATDDGWFERKRRPILAKFDETDDRGRPPSNRVGVGNGRRRERPPKEQRQAMGLASEWLVFQYLRRRYGETVDEACWISRNRAHFFGGDEGDDTAGYDFCVKTPQAEWLYEVKSSLEDTCEFELTPNEMRVAASVPARGRRRYRILYVPFVFSPNRWTILELPNPMGERSRNRFKEIGRSSVRFRFETSSAQR